MRLASCLCVSILRVPEHSARSQEINWQKVDETLGRKAA